MVQFDDSHVQGRHHHNDTPFEYFQWKRQGVVGRIAHYIAPSPVTVAWLVVFVAVCAVIAAATLGIGLPGGW